MAEEAEKRKSKIEKWKEMEGCKRERTVSESNILDKWLKRKREEQ